MYSPFNNLLYICRKSFDVEKIITHPNYGGTTGYDNDIAVLKLKTKVKLFLFL